MMRRLQYSTPSVFLALLGRFQQGANKALLGAVEDQPLRVPLHADQKIVLA